MKPLLLSGMAAIVVGGIIISTQSSVEEYVAEPLIEVQEVAPEWASDEDAVEAAKAVIRKKELTAESKALADQIKALQDQKAVVDKELGSY
jgi:hypothetical protein